MVDIENITENITENKLFKEEVMSKRFLASYGVLRIAPYLSVVIEGAALDGMNVDAFSADQKREIREFALSYTEDVLLTGNSKELWAIIPSIFPATSFCAALRFELPSTEVLRLAREDKKKSFVVSELLGLKSAKMSARIGSYKEEFLRLCESLRDCFCDLYRLDRCESDAERRILIEKQCYELSYFTGCPIELDFVGEEKGLSKVDFTLFSTFLYTMLASARNNSLRREAKVTVSSDSKGASVIVEFEGDPMLCLSHEQLEWSKTANDKGMFVCFSSLDRIIRAEFRPLIDESVYTEIKQFFNVRLK